MPHFCFISLLFIAALKQNKTMPNVRKVTAVLLYFLFRLKWSSRWSLPVGSLAWKGCRPGNRLGCLGSRSLLSLSKLMGHGSPCCFSESQLARGLCLGFTTPRDLSVLSAALGQQRRRLWLLYILQASFSCRKKTSMHTGFESQGVYLQQNTLLRSGNAPCPFTL